MRVTVKLSDQLWLTLFLLCLGCGRVVCAAEGDSGADRYWGQWRGPLGTGVGPQANPPVEWSETKNVRWKVGIPGKGHSTPVVWGGRIFLTAAIPYGEALAPRYSGAPGAHDNLPVTRRQEFVVLAVDRREGKIVWQRSVHKALPLEGGHETASFASGSPVTDGEHLVAFFGSHGLYCLNLDGEVQWEKSFGQMQTKHGHGEGGSPALYGDTVVVNWDHEAQSFLVALDKRTGEQRWRVVREEVTSWATPIIVEQAGRPQVIVSGTGRIRGYDLGNGSVVWECGGLSHNVVASPVTGGGMVYAGSSYETRNLLAIRLEGARGDITGSDQVVWSSRRGTPYVPSLLLDGESLFFLSHYQGFLSHLRARTGEPVGSSPFRLSGVRNIYASPVGAAGRIYITDLDGKTLVMTRDEKTEILALNSLNDSFSASAALVEGEIYLRGQRHLYCIAED